MTVKKFIPVSLMIAVIAALYVLVGPYLKIGGLMLNVLWVPFISWPLYFIAGAKPSRIHKEAFSLAGGVIFGFLTIWALPYSNNLFGSILGMPVVILFVAFIIVMLELTDWFELAPAYFFAFAGYFAYVFGGFAGTLKDPGDYAYAMIPFYLTLMIGLLLGYVTAYLRKKILEKEGIFGAAQETVFDKEKPQS